MKFKVPPLVIPTSLPPEPPSAPQPVTAQPATTPHSRGRFDSPRRDRLSPRLYAAPNASVSGAVPTSSAARGPELGSEKFLGETMGRPDLVEFMSWINLKIPLTHAPGDHAPSNWAFTGSVAILIHGHALNCELAKNRQSNDVDVITSEFDRLNDELSKPDEKCGHKGDRTADTFNFNGKFDVDVINCKNDKKQSFGILQKDVQVIHGVPVLSQRALLASKRAVLPGVESPAKAHDIKTPDAVAQSKVGKANEADSAPDEMALQRQKVLRDIEILETLQKIAIPSDLENPYQTFGYHPLESIFKAKD